MTKPPNQDTEVDEQIMDIYMEATAMKLTPKQFSDNLKSALNLYYKSILLEVIGADEDINPLSIWTENYYIHRNKLRQEQRQRLESRLGK